MFASVRCVTVAYIGAFLFPVTTILVDGHLADHDEHNTVSDRDRSGHQQRIRASCQPGRRLHHRPRHHSPRVRSQRCWSEPGKVGSCELPKSRNISLSHVRPRSARMLFQSLTVNGIGYGRYGSWE